MKLFKKWGFVSIEVVIIAVIILGAGISGIAMMGSSGGKLMSDGLGKLDVLGIFGGGSTSPPGSGGTGELVTGYDESLGIREGDINPDSDFLFELSPSGDSYIVVKYLNTSDLDPVVPATYNGLPITEIGGSAMSTRSEYSSPTLMLSKQSTIDFTSQGESTAFLGGSAKKLKSVVLPDSIQIIGTRAFADNDLTSIILPASLTTIGDGAFSNNKLTKVIIPETVTSLGNRSFELNKLKEVTLPEGLTTISANAFASNELTTIDLPESVRTINASAFLNNQLTELELPSGIVSIGDSAFRGNSISTVTVPSTLTTLQASAFRDNELTSVVFEGPRPSSLGSNIFTGNTNLPDSSILVPANHFAQYKSAASSLSVTIAKIAINPLDANLEDDFVFAWDTATNGWSITSYVNNDRKDVVIPDTRADGLPITAVANYAFQNKGLTSLVLPESLRTIGVFSFASNNLESIVFPSSLTRLENSSFRFNKLTDITFLSGPPSFTSGWDPSTGAVFRDNPVQSGGVKVPSVHFWAYNDTTPNGVAARLGVIGKIIVNPDDENVEGDFAYQWNASLNGWEVIRFAGLPKTAASIPAERADGLPVVSIIANAFDGVGLTSLTLPEGLVNIGNFAFRNNQLASVVMPNSVTTVGTHAFQNNQLTSLSLGSGLRTIGLNAFHTNKLITLVIPSSVTSVGTSAFRNNSLVGVTFLGAVPPTLGGTGSASVFGNGTGANNTLPVGGIKVPTTHLSAYISRAASLGVATDRIVGQ